MSSTLNPTVIVLACGLGRRFRASLHEAGVLEGEDNGWGNKLHARLGQRRVLDWTVDAAQSSGYPVYVHEGQAHEGMGDSIAAAVRHTHDAQGWLVLPGDLPLILPDTIALVAQALNQHPIVVPQWLGNRAHPVGFSPVCAQALQSVSGEAGAASVVKGMGAWLMDVDDPGVARDVDTWADLQHVRSHIVHETQTLKKKS